MAKAERGSWRLVSHPGRKLVAYIILAQEAEAEAGGSGLAPA